MIIRTPEDTLPISDLLRDVLVCPRDRADLREEGQALVCTRCGRAYPVEQGIPNMLVEGE